MCAVVASMWDVATGVWVLQSLCGLQQSLTLAPTGEDKDEE